jgi:hypothetical protein
LLSCNFVEDVTEKVSFYTGALTSASLLLRKNIHGRSIGTLVLIIRH